MCLYGLPISATIRKKILPPTPKYFHKEQWRVRMELLPTSKVFTSFTSKVFTSGERQTILFLQTDEVRVQYHRLRLRLVLRPLPNFHVFATTPKQCLISFNAQNPPLPCQLLCSESSAHSNPNAVFKHCRLNKSVLYHISSGLLSLSSLCKTANSAPVIPLQKPDSSHFHIISCVYPNMELFFLN